VISYTCKVEGRELADKLNMRRKWKAVDSAAVGVCPRYMGIGPIPVY
jgi:hypothetical protein